MQSFRKTSDAAFIEAILANDNATISRYYQDTCSPMIKQLARRFPKAPEEVVSTAVNDAMLTVITQYIETKKIYVEEGKVIGTRQGKISALIAYIARCGVIRHFKWLQKYGTADIDDHIRKLEKFDVALDEEEAAKSNRSVMQAFTSLNEKCQELLSCRLIHGMSYEEVLNEELGTSTGGLRVEAHRCVKQLRARFLQFFFEAAN